MLKEYKGDILRLVIGITIYLFTLIISSYKLLLILLSYAILGYPILIKLINNFIKGKNLVENLIIVIVTIGSLYLKNYYEAIIIILIYQLFNYFKIILLERIDKETNKINKLKINNVNLKLDDNIITVNIERVRINDIIVVNPYEIIPLDGIIINGASTIDSSLVTSTNNIHEVTVNNHVLSGSKNIDSPLEIKVTHNINDSTITSILKMLPRKSNSKTLFDHLIITFHRYHFIISILIFLLFIILSIFSNTIIFKDWLQPLLGLLLLTNTWSLFLITPLAYNYNLNQCLKKGIFIKKKNSIDSLINIKTLIFDLEETLTKGEYSISKIIPYQVTEEELLMYTTYTTYRSNDNIALVLKEKYHLDINKKDITDFEIIEHFGYKAVVKGSKVIVGTKEIFNKYKIKFPDVDILGLSLLVAINNEYIGTIVLEDELKSDSLDMISKLQQDNKNITILTNSSKRLADRLSNKLKINDIYANLSINEKKMKILQLKKDQNIAYIGNNLELMKLADLCITLNNKNIEVIENSDIVINNQDINNIIKAINVSYKTKERVFINTIVTIVLKLICSILSLCGLLSLSIIVIIEIIVLLIIIINTFIIQKRD